MLTPVTRPPGAPHLRRHACGDEVPQQRHDGHVLRGSVCGLGGRWPETDDHAGLLCCKFGGKAGQPWLATVGIADIDHDVAAFDVPAHAQPLAKGLKLARETGLVGDRQHAYASRLTGRLREGRCNTDQHVQRRTAGGQQPRAPPH